MSAVKSIEQADTCARVIRINFALKTPAPAELKWAAHEHNIVQLVCGENDIDLAFLIGTSTDPKGNVCVCQGCSRGYLIDPVTAEVYYDLVRETKVASKDENWECDVCEAQYVGGTGTAPGAGNGRAEWVIINKQAHAFARRQGAMGKPLTVPVVFMQLCAVDGGPYRHSRLFALASDGTVWSYELSGAPELGSSDGPWVKVPLPNDETGDHRHCCANCGCTQSELRTKCDVTRRCGDCREFPAEPPW